MSLQLAYNTSDAPVTVDSAGFQIGGRSWGVVDSTDVRGKAELGDTGVLRRVDEDKARKATDNPGVVAALADLDRRRELAEAAKSASKEQLAEGLPAEVVDGLDVGGDGLPAKSDLEDAAVAAGDVPEPKPAKKTASRSAAK